MGWHIMNYGEQIPEYSSLISMQERNQDSQPDDTRKLEKISPLKFMQKRNQLSQSNGFKIGLGSTLQVGM
jgi:hypothetical protein